MRNKVDILLVVRWPVGGIRTFIKYVYRNFPALRCRIVLVAPNLPETQCLLADLGGLLRSHTLLPGQPSGAAIAREVLSQLRRSCFDLVHSHGFTSGLAAAIPAGITRTPHIVTSHDILQKSQFHGATGLLRKAALAALLPLATAIHSVSHDAEGNLLEFVPILKQFRRRLVVIPNGIDIAQFARKQPPRDLHRELSLAEDAFLIGFFGRFMSQKGFAVLAEALKLLLGRSELRRPPFLVCFGSGGFHREERARIDRMGLSERICFLPFVDDIASSLQGIDVVAMPSLWEACPLLPMETLVSGTPLIGTDAIGLREVLRGTPCRVVAKGDAVALAEALQQEIVSSSKGAALAFAPSAARRFDVRESSAALENLIRAIAGRRSWAYPEMT